MSTQRESRAVSLDPTPHTRQSLAQGLREGGVRAGELLLVHTSMSAIGWVCGGEVALIQALLDALGPEGTLVVPTHTSGNSEPSRWQYPPVPEAWWPAIRAHMPAFDPAITPTRGMGRVPELLRAWPGARRSQHPSVSFAALGPLAAAITDDHALAFGLGDRSPLARIYDLDGRVLLLGVDFDRNTSFHLAEHRAASAPPITEGGAALDEEGRRAWRTWPDLDVDAGAFVQIGRDLEAAGHVHAFTLGAAPCRLFHQPTAVDFATAALSRPLEVKGSPA